MTTQKENPYISLLQDASQFEVDFVIPRVGTDLPVGIDPFLLFKSRDPQLSNIHQTILTAFNYGIQKIKQNDLDDASIILPLFWTSG
jgi:hypothetical protein